MSATVDANRIVAVERYARSIRSPAKRRYALALLRFMKRGGPAPERPNGLSVMGAQAVEIRFRSLWQATSDAF